MKIRILPAFVIATVLSMMAPPAVAGEATGAYLAARQARYDKDFAAAAQYFTRALTQDPSNPAILENAVVAHVALGRVDRAVPIARKIEADGLRSQVASMALIADAAIREAHDDILARLKDGRGMGALGDGLIRAWTYLGKGDMTKALAEFDKVATEPGLHAFAIYHKALALASVGDFEGSDKIFSGKSDGPLQRTRRGIIAWAQILSQLERDTEAVALIDDTFGTDLDPEIAQLRAALSSGERVPFALVHNSQDGIAEVFFSLGQALMSETGEDYVLLYARIAEFLKPDHIDAIIMSAELLEGLERYELATEAYKRVPRDHPSFHAAELGRSDALRRSGKTDAAIEVLERLAETHPDLPMVHVAAGDLYRQLERFGDAVKAYDRALALYAERDTDQWFVHYTRGISHERLDDWKKAEIDFRKALELKPDQPQVLNYLGYTMVEKQVNLDEALNMIERAVKARPDSGYIVDSLGWVLYRLGRYEEAIGHMEHAAELEPVDPVVNDHLGDVLWAVGRYNEARFQWKRALSFVEKGSTTSDADPDRIRRKLEVGLDVVLSEEGSEPLKVANETD
ncbi:lipoprotein NlpI [Roseovarius litorisediminis]|uniref:Lipoprotein NlpI n=1 Tax=Roseovarius litorisediminis TaxID=1312363 RepID=A0A1Y5RPC3_9RHOB|nr:tetratricopeptide repeat protein [Roseovarius litorisediminis]SLN22203.1 lipoprotein NlpI [Roseovarius litorisediminis]